MNVLKLRLCPGPIGRCFYCSEPCEIEALTVDHFIPLSKGGRRGLLNAVLACEPCNKAKADADPRRMGLRFATPVTPLQVRALADLKAMVLMRRAALARKRASQTSSPVARPAHAPRAQHARPTHQPQHGSLAMANAEPTPAFDCFHVDDRGDGRMALRAIGAAWSTTSGGGYTLMLDCVPLNGRLLLLPHQTAQDVEDGGDDSGRR